MHDTGSDARYVIRIRLLPCLAFRAGNLKIEGSLLNLGGTICAERTALVKAVVSFRTSHARSSLSLTLPNLAERRYHLVCRARSRHVRTLTVPAYLVSDPVTRSPIQGRRQSHLSLRDVPPGHPRVLRSEHADPHGSRRLR